MKNYSKHSATAIFFLLLFPFACQAQETDKEKDTRRREFIENFLETYIAAYEHMDIDYISDFFSTNSLIITETKQLSKTGPEIAPSSTKKRPYKLIVEDKATYIKRLKSIFDQNTRIKLGIADKFVMKHGKYPEIYGVSFLQLWKDQEGGDNLESQMPGYIFLMIDFKVHGELEPVIHVRTWQPQENIKTINDKYLLYDFNVYDF